MDIDIKDIDYLYTGFFYEGKDLKYKLVAERATPDKKNREAKSPNYGRRNPFHTDPKPNPHPPILLIFL